MRNTDIESAQEKIEIYLETASYFEANKIRSLLNLAREIQPLLVELCQEYELGFQPGDDNSDYYFLGDDYNIKGYILMEATQHPFGSILDTFKPFLNPSLAFFLYPVKEVPLHRNNQFAIGKKRNFDGSGSDSYNLLDIIEVENEKALALEDKTFDSIFGIFSYKLAYDIFCQNNILYMDMLPLIK